ncbi:flagellar hook-length control protein FliK [Puniceibacterium sediminis]|uniref:flagellar hook-length control protein FliK n=1 Tax=Puniceibacterium sediminis TaxID=1608407 RepID=UPI0015961AC4|nr:flagellar hook-length control protein FliK [Puniceibacterium sediminis]
MAQASAEPSPATKRFSSLFAAMGREGQSDRDARSDSGLPQGGVRETEESTDSSSVTEAEALAADTGINADLAEEEGRTVRIPYLSAKSPLGHAEDIGAEDSVEEALVPPLGKASRGTGIAESNLSAMDPRKQAPENQKTQRFNLMSNQPVGTASNHSPGSDPKSGLKTGLPAEPAAAVVGAPPGIPAAGRPGGSQATSEDAVQPSTASRIAPGTMAQSGQAALGTNASSSAIRAQSGQTAVQTDAPTTPNNSAGLHEMPSSSRASENRTDITLQPATAMTDAEKAAMAIAFKTSLQRTQRSPAGASMPVATAAQRAEQQSGQTIPTGQRIIPEGSVGEVAPILAATGQLSSPSARFIRSSARDESFAHARSVTTDTTAATPQSVKTAAPVPVQSVSVPFSAEVLTGDTAESEELAPLPPLFGDARSQAQASQMPGVIQPIRGDHGASAMRQMIEVTGQLKDGPVDLRLNPEELGRVRMHMVSSENGIVMHITSERPETLDLLRRHIDQLHRELTDLGYTSVDFTFGQQGYETGTGDAPNGGTESSRSAPSGSSEQSAPLPTPLSVASDGLDIRL